MSFTLKFGNAKTLQQFTPKDGDTKEGQEYANEISASSITANSGEQPINHQQWLRQASKTYNISPNLEDYVIVNTPMVPSDIPNRNGIAFPLHELTKFRPPPVRNIMYRAWQGCPTHKEHEADIYTNAFGIILDTSLVQIKNYGGGRHWMVMALLAFDKTKNPERVQDIANGRVNTYSMGANCAYFSCGITGRPLNPENPLDMQRIQNPLEFGIKPHPLDMTQYLTFKYAHDLVPGECSTVDDPAWAPALSDIVFDVSGAI